MTALDKRKRTVLVYNLYLIFSEPLFWGPVVILSLQTLAHMPLDRIFMMEAIVMGILVLCNIPAGALADVIGNKRALLIGRVLLLGSSVLFTVMTNELGAWVANVIWAIGYSLVSGTESSILYETLHVGGYATDFKKVRGTAVSWRFFVVAFLALTVGFLVLIDPRLPLMLSIPGMVVSLLLACCMSESRRTERYSFAAQTTAFRQGVAFVVRTRFVLWIVGFASLIAAVSKVWFFMYNPYFALVQVPITHYGFIFFLLNVTAWLSSRYAHLVEKVMKESTLVAASLACIAVPIVLMALFPVYLMAYLVLAQNVVRGFIRPFTEDLVHHHVTVEGNYTEWRTTILSVKETVMQFSSTLALVVVAVLLQFASLLVVLGITGSICLVLGAACMVQYYQLTKTERITTPF